MFMPTRKDYLRMLLSSLENASRISLWTENAQFLGQICVRGNRQFFQEGRGQASRVVDEL